LNPSFIKLKYNI